MKKYITLSSSNTPLKKIFHDSPAPPVLTAKFNASLDIIHNHNRRYNAEKKNTNPLRIHYETKLIFSRITGKKYRKKNSLFFEDCGEESA